VFNKVINFSSRLLAVFYNTILWTCNKAYNTKQLVFFAPPVKRKFTNSERDGKGGKKANGIMLSKSADAF
jgi:hypothetical protein